MPGSLPARSRALLLTLGLFAAGCEPQATTAPGAPAVAPVAAGAPLVSEIPWFPGSVEEAFATAKRERRPLFLYWGAVWCPPCHYLKTKLFPRPEFVARMRGFVPVYLDGDSPSAQTWAERLGTEGYPTVIVLDPDGRELTRLPSMLPVEDYAEVLDRAVTMTRPIGELVAEVTARGPAAMAPADLNLLAFYAWEQSAVELDEATQTALFARLWRETPAELLAERSRFLAHYLVALGGAEPRPELAEAERATLTTALLDLLADPATRRINLELIQLSAGEVVTLLAPAAGAERTAVAGAWTAAAHAIEEDAALTVDDRLSAANALIAVAELTTTATAGAAAPGTPAATLPADLVAHVRARVRWANEQVHDDHELQAVMSSMTGLLADVGLGSEAEALVDERLADTLAPYYFLSVKASLRAKAGDGPVAVALYRQAWESARSNSSPVARRDAAPAGSTPASTARPAAAGSGGATAQGSDGGMTTFRWGSSYLRKAIELTPEAGEQIAADTATILGDLLASSDPFAGGNWSRLQGLEKSLVAWNREGQRGASTIAAAQRLVGEACARIPVAGADSPGERCRQFLQPVS